MRREGDYYGTAVNKAARIASIAEAGEIIASAITAELSGIRDVDFDSSRTVSLKGLDGTHVVVPVDWVSST